MARDTAVNPAVLDAFALAIVGDGQGPAFPGVSGARVLEQERPAFSGGQATVRSSQPVHRAQRDPLKRMARHSYPTTRVVC